jgi:hypothetical protein
VVADRLPNELTPGEGVLVDVHVVSDLRDPIDGLSVVADLTWPGGRHRWAWSGALDADSVARVGSINWTVPDATGQVELALELRDRGGASIARNHYNSEIGIPPRA